MHSPTPTVPHIADGRCDVRHSPAHEEPNMPVITFEQIAQRLAEHQAAEAVRNNPKAVARRCVFELSSALADLGAIDCQSVLELLRDEVLGLPVIA
jgi:hypothetical protein